MVSIMTRLKMALADVCQGIFIHRYTLLIFILLMQLMVFFSSFYLWAASYNVRINPYGLWNSDSMPVFLPKKFFRSPGGFSVLGADRLSVQLNTEVNLSRQWRPAKKKYMRHTLIEILDMLPINERKVKYVNCAAIFRNDTKEISSALNKTMNSYFNLVAEAANNCDSFRKKSGYINHHLSEMERDFPIAFSILVHKDITQMERLLRTIYRPQNSYCIHVDKKAKQSIRDAVGAIAECFNNVFVSSALIDVTPGRFSLLKADINCITELLDKYKQWKYFINLSGNEFPLKSNYELVKILQAYNKTNDLEQYEKDTDPALWQKVGPPSPYGIPPIIGSRQVVIGRTFADFCVHHTYGENVYNWTRYVQNPDQLFFSTLSVTNVGAPGAYKGDKNTDTEKRPYLARFKTLNRTGLHHRDCGGRWSNGVCVFGLADLPLIYTRKELFATKFDQDFQPAALDCLEELILNKTRDYYYEQGQFDVSYYKQLDMVKNRIYI